MTGPIDSILGTKVNVVIDKFLLQTPQYFSVAEGPVRVNGAVFDIDPESSRILSVKRVNF
jgi:calcineurin-like phosphoesterase